jgi:hypothetical protein
MHHRIEGLLDLVRHGLAAAADDPVCHQVRDVVLGVAVGARDEPHPVSPGEGPVG